MKFELKFILEVNGTQFNQEVKDNYGKGKYKECLIDSIGDISKVLQLEMEINSEVKKLECIDAKRVL